MVLHVDLDAEYLTMPESRNCYADNFYLRDWHSASPKTPTPIEMDQYTKSVKLSAMLCPPHLKLKHVLPSTTVKQTSTCIRN